MKEFGLSIKISPNLVKKFKCKVCGKKKLVFFKPKNRICYQCQRNIDFNKVFLIMNKELIKGLRRIK